SHCHRTRWRMRACTCRLDRRQRLPPVRYRIGAPRRNIAEQVLGQGLLGRGWPEAAVGIVGAMRNLAYVHFAAVAVEIHSDEPEVLAELRGYRKHLGQVSWPRNAPVEIGRASCRERMDVWELV